MNTWVIKTNKFKTAGSIMDEVQRIIKQNTKGHSLKKSGREVFDSSKIELDRFFDHLIYTSTIRSYKNVKISDDKNEYHFIFRRRDYSFIFRL